MHAESFKQRPRKPGLMFFKEHTFVGLAKHLGIARRQYRFQVSRY
jgi:hypothetical protein